MTDSTCFFTVSMKSLWNRTQFQKAPQDILRKLPEWCFISCRKMMKRRRRDCWPWEDRERERWIIRLVQNLLESSCGNTEATDCLWQVRKKNTSLFFYMCIWVHSCCSTVKIHIITESRPPRLSDKMAASKTESLGLLMMLILTFDLKKNSMVYLGAFS